MAATTIPRLPTILRISILERWLRCHQIPGSFSLPIRLKLPVTRRRTRSWPARIQGGRDDAAVGDCRRRCLIVHEDNGTAGFGAEIAAVLAKDAFFDLDAPIERMTMPDVPSPHSALLLDAVVPSVARLAEAMRTLVAV